MITALKWFFPQLVETPGNKSSDLKWIPLQICLNYQELGGGFLLNEHPDIVPVQLNDRKTNHGVSNPRTDFYKNRPACKVKIKGTEMLFYNSADKHLLHTVFFEMKKDARCLHKGKKYFYCLRKDRHVILNSR